MVISSHQHGGETGFTQFFEARQRLYVRIAYTILGSWPAAEDATQEAFAVLYRKWHTITEPTPDPYARRVLVNTCLGEVRRRRRRPAPDLVDAVLPDPAVAGSERMDLVRALRSLDATSRAVVALRYLHDLPVREVALALDMPEGSVKSRCARALDRLREEMAAPGVVSLRRGVTAPPDVTRTSRTDTDPTPLITDLRPHRSTR